MGDNNWRDMNAAEWRGKIGAKIENLEELVTKIAERVHAHESAIAVLDDRHHRSGLSMKARAIIAAAVITSLGSIVVALITLVTVGR